jgi:hypothetical protein
LPAAKIAAELFDLRCRAFDILSDEVLVLASQMLTSLPKRTGSTLKGISKPLSAALDLRCDLLLRLAGQVTGLVARLVNELTPGLFDLLDHPLRIPALGAIAGVGVTRRGVISRHELTPSKTS